MSLQPSADNRSASKLDYLTEQLEEIRSKGLFTTIRTLESAQGAWLQIDGRKLLNFCSNNYLGFANDPEIVQAACEATERYGVGPGAVRTIAGTMEIHNELERRLAAFKDVDDTIVLQSGRSIEDVVVSRNDAEFVVLNPWNSRLPGMTWEIPEKNRLPRAKVKEVIIEDPPLVGRIDQDVVGVHDRTAILGGAGGRDARHGPAEVRRQGDNHRPYCGTDRADWQRRNVRFRIVILS